MGHSSGSIVPTIRFTRRKLPHWEVGAGRYFVTVRCAGSLPNEVTGRLAEVAQAMALVEPRSPQFAALQRESFRTLEKYLDHAADGVLVDDAARLLASEFESITEIGFEIPHFSILPNHWHALLVSKSATPRELSAVMKRIKGRSGKRLRKLLGGAGPIWQREWFDHWVRDEGEWDRIVAYIRGNPVKAKIVSRWEDHPWTK